MRAPSPRLLPSLLGTLALGLWGCATDAGTANAGYGADTTAEEVRVCGSGTRLPGIDVSVYQGHVDWNRVAGSGIRFGFARVGDGLGHDDTFATNWAGMRAAGLVRGAYQFFRPSHSASAQADLMIAAVGHLGPGDLPPVLDVEVTDGHSAVDIAAGVRTWVSRVQAATGRTPIIYTGFYFWRDQVRGASLPQHNPLWVAAYGVSCPSVPTPWTTWAFWQHADHGNVPGVAGTSLDVDYFNGTLAQLHDLAGGAPPGH